MLVDTSAATATSAVTGAIHQASQATGTSFTYLLATAQVESGLNPHAGASTSSARGLFQFVEQTWLGTMKDAGPALGYGRYAAAITRTASGRLEVKDPVMRSEILKLRNDPTANAVMAGAFTKANATILTNKLGRPPTEGELYIAHFLGAGGAARLISLAASNPHAKADDYFGNAALANRPIFYDRHSGGPRSLAQVRDVLTARYNVARARSDDLARTAQAQPQVQATRSADGPLDLTAMRLPIKAAARVPDTAGITGAFAAAMASSSAPPPLPMQIASAPIAESRLADAPVAAAPAAAAPVAAAAIRTGQMFHGLFQETEGAPPDASVVSQIWTAPTLPSSGDSPVAAPAPGTMFDLFRDPVKRS